MPLDDARGDVIRLTPERQAALLAYCKLTELAEDPEVQLLIPLMYAGAVGYMEDAGVCAPESGTTRAALYDLCVNYMVADMWDRRDVSTVGLAASDNPVFRRYFNQLKWAQGGGYG